MRITSASLLIFYFNIFYGEALVRKKVCVIGAGRSGLAALKLLADEIDTFEPIAFERNADVGGLWIYTEKTDFDEQGLSVHSSIYKNLRTNLPKQLMIYPDYPNFEGQEASDFVSHETFVEYMKNYTDNFGLRKYIQFSTIVTKVTPIKGKDDWRTTRWLLKKKNFKTKIKDSTVCDAVMVCNGHFSKPNIPKIPGIETFPGRVIHSRSYRRPESFSNQTVVVLGAGASGLDISRDLSHHAKTIYLSHRHKYNPFSAERPENVRVVSGVVAANGSKLILQDKSQITADAFIYCTGYLYDFPFLDKSSGIVVERNKVRMLHDQCINVKHPSMAFIGLTDDVIFSGLYYSQSDYFFQILQGKQQLPSYNKMLEDEKWQLQQMMKMR